MEAAITRRSFAKVSGLWILALASIGSVFTAGCDIWSQIQAWVPAGIAAFESVVTLVAPLAAPGIDAIAELVKAGFASLASAVNQYINAPAADKATFKQKVLLILSQLTGDIQNFLSSVNVGATNPIVKIVLGLVAIILSTIQGFTNAIGASAVTSASLRMAGVMVSVTPVKRDRKRFVSDFNGALVSAGHPELQIH